MKVKSVAIVKYQSEKMDGGTGRKTSGTANGKVAELSAVHVAGYRI